MEKWTLEFTLYLMFSSREDASLMFCFFQVCCLVGSRDLVVSGIYYCLYFPVVYVALRYDYAVSSVGCTRMCLFFLSVCNARSSLLLFVTFWWFAVLQILDITYVIALLVFYSCYARFNIGNVHIE